MIEQLWKILSSMVGLKAKPRLYPGMPGLTPEERAYFFAFQGTHEKDRKAWTESR